jgi:hypothetical protein
VAGQKRDTAGEFGDEGCQRYDEKRYEKDIMFG